MTKTYSAHMVHGEYMSGWRPADSDQAKQLKGLGLAHYMSGWGMHIHDSVIKELTNGAAPTTEGATVEFSQDDVDRVADLIKTIRERREAKRAKIRMIECDCGHTVPENEVMRASLGTACFDCYDRMSDEDEW